MSLRETQENKFYFGNKGKLIVPENPFEEEAQRMRDEKEVEEATKKLLELAKLKQEELDKKLATLEMLPLGQKVILLPYPENPYRKLMSDGGLIVEYNGAFKNPDTGEWDKQQTLIGCAQVIEVGPDCKQVQPLDDVFYDTRSVLPIPFLNMGYRLTSEPQLLCVLNTGLKTRFKMD